MTKLSIEVQNVSLTYKVVNSVSLKDRLRLRNSGESRIEYVRALDNVSFHVKKGQTIGIIGSNGAGKSTLLKTLAGIFSPDSGEIKLHSNSVSLLTLGAGFETNLTGIENIYSNGILLGLSRRQIDKRLRQIIDFADIGGFIDKPVRTYSSGMRSRLAFAVAANVEPDILLLDEMMGVGDEDFRAKSSKSIRDLIRAKRSVVIVSHNLKTVEELCQAVLWLEKGKVQHFGGAKVIISQYKQFVRQRQARRRKALGT